MKQDFLALHSHYLRLPYMNEKRRVRVLLPAHYDAEKDTYPVLYMHDGQNVFYSKEAYAGYSWKMIPLLKEDQTLPKLIVVGIDNSSDQRFDEYMPWQVDEGEGGLGKDYAQWLVEVVKPFIDRHYRTKKGPQTTLLAGSSLGGVITAYIGHRYPEIFGGLGIFSMASWLSEEKFRTYVCEHPLDLTAKVYIQTGTNESNEVDQMFIEKDASQAYIDSSIDYYQALLQQGHDLKKLSLKIYAGEHHFEKYWADHFGEFLHFFFD